MIVCIAEKPSVAREIATVLGANTRRDGYMEGNGYCVTWTFGHLCELKEPADYGNQWRSWSIVHLPIMPDRFGIKLKNDNGIREQFAVIQRLVTQATEVINCGDAGQEGELIQRWVLQLCGCSVPVKRLWLSSMTTEAIKEAFGNLREDSAYVNLYHAGMARAIGDWLLGMNATRLYTVKYQQGGLRRTLSVGRVQTPTLALIVERYEQIQSFVPEPYWEIKTLYRDTKFASTQGRYATAEEAEEVIQIISKSELFITDLTKKKGKEAPPRLFDLTSLQIEVNKKYGYSADDTLAAVQALYERKLVTYPRVDTTYLTTDIYTKCPQIMNGLYSYVPDLVTPLAHKKLPKPKKVFDDSKVTDHHAIIPTGERGHFISTVETQIYDLIVKRFIAVFYPDMQYEQTTVLAKIEDIDFKATGRTIVDAGWKFIYQSDVSTADASVDDDTDDRSLLPDFTVGEHGVHKPDLLEKQTQPPKLYTEATLLNAMETAGKFVEDDELKEAMKQKGIGRPSTRAAIIQTLLQRGYIRKERKSLIPTPIGIELIHTIHNDLLKSVQLTGEWEYKLRLIDQGKYDPAQFIQELKRMVSDLVREVISDPRPMEAVLAEAKEEARKRAEKANEEEAKKNRSKSAKRARKAKKVKEGDQCPKCKDGTILRGKQALGCSRFREGCDFRHPFNDEA